MYFTNHVKTFFPSYWKRGTQFIEYPFKLKVTHKWYIYFSLLITLIRWEISVDYYIMFHTSIEEDRNFTLPRSMFHWCFLRSEEHTSELQSRLDLVCRPLLANIN